MPPQPAPNRERVDRFRNARDYFRDPTRLVRWRQQLSILAIVIAGGWLAIGWALPQDARQYRYTHGPVADPHTAWNQRCNTCHAGSSPESIVSLSSLLDVHSRWHEFKCDTCHQGTADEPKNYAPHHFNALWKDTQATDCGQCHHDHQGRDASLVGLPDTDCTQCHKDLKDHHAAGQPNFIAAIGRFDGGHEDSHPPFRDIPLDLKRPRTLHFNHAIHLKPGIVSDKAFANKTNAVWTIEDIDAKFRERYRLPGQADGEAVVLSCSSCHQLDAGRMSEKELLGKDSQEIDRQRKREEATSQLLRTLPRDTALPLRSAGAYMLPINYENHCQACHAIETGPVSSPASNKPVNTLVPHRLQNDEIETFLRREFIRQLAKSMPKKPVPKEFKARDRLDPRVDEQLKQLRSLEDLVGQLVKKSMDQLYMPIQNRDGGFGGKNCLKCHEANSEARGKTRDDSGSRQSWTIVPPNTPALWFEHARFNHASHSMMNCAACHPVQGRPYVAGEVEPIFIPGIDNCRQCHAPSHRVEINGKMELRGGVRHGCVDCHRYHNGDLSLQGRGSQPNSPDDRRLDMMDLLRGARPKRDAP